MFWWVFQIDLNSVTSNLLIGIIVSYKLFSSNMIWNHFTWLKYWHAKISSIQMTDVISFRQYWFNAIQNHKQHYLLWVFCFPIWVDICISIFVPSIDYIYLFNVVIRMLMNQNNVEKCITQIDLLEYIYIHIMQIKCCMYTILHTMHLVTKWHFKKKW